jgi:hypothetical protein
MAYRREADPGSNLSLPQRSGTTFISISSEERIWTVGELAEAAGVMVRALHHYDHLGLLSAKERAEAGYRLR